MEHQMAAVEIQRVTVLGLGSMELQAGTDWLLAPGLRRSAQSLPVAADPAASLVQFLVVVSEVLLLGAMSMPSDGLPSGNSSSETSDHYYIAELEV